MFKRLGYWPQEGLLEVGALQRMQRVIGDKVIETVEHDILNQVVLGLTALLLGPDSTVAYAWRIVPASDSTLSIQNTPKSMIP